VYGPNPVLRKISLTCSGESPRHPAWSNRLPGGFSIQRADDLRVALTLAVHTHHLDRQLARADMRAQ
jgi:hypothetical protein